MLKKQSQATVHAAHGARNAPAVSGYPGGPVATFRQGRSINFPKLPPASPVPETPAMQHIVFLGRFRMCKFFTYEELDSSTLPQNSSYVCIERVSSGTRVDQMPARGPGAVGELGGRIRAGLPILDIFSPGTYRVGYFKAKNRTVPVLLWDWHLLCVLQALPCPHSVSFSSPQVF